MIYVLQIVVRRLKRRNKKPNERKNHKRRIEREKRKNYCVNDFFTFRPFIKHTSTIFYSYTEENKYIITIKNKDSNNLHAIIKLYN